MGKIKKILCMLLVCTVIIVPCSLLGSVFAQTDNSIPLTVEVTTDKSSYTAYGIAEITVNVTNTSDETLNNIIAEAVFNDLAPVGKSNETFKEIESLKSGESFNFSYKATVNASKVKLNFFEKIILWFVRLFNGEYSATENDFADGRELIEQTYVIDFGKITANNLIKVKYGSRINDVSTKQMKEVEMALDELVTSQHYENLNNSEKITAIENLLIELSENGTDNMQTQLIKPESIFYDEETEIIYFEHACGIRSGVIVKKYNNMLASQPIDNTVLSSSTNYGDKNSINSVLMYGWDKSEDEDSHYNDYDDFVKKISQYDVYSTIYDNPTISDYKTAFLNMDFIFIAEHGINYTNKMGEKLCGFGVYGDNVSDENNNEKYIDDIDQNLIQPLYDVSIDSKLRNIYVILPKFFEHYYCDKLKNSVVVVGSCSGFGKDGEENYSLASVFHNACGADVVIGFHNDTFIAYSLAITENFTQNLLYGYTASESLNMSIDTCGSDDIIHMYREYAPSHSAWWNNPDSKDNKTGKQKVDEKFVISGASYPCIYGKEDKKIGSKASNISGTIKDKLTNNIVSGVIVEFVNNSSDSLDPIATAKTDENGQFSINLPYGDYSISFNHENYKNHGISLTVDSDYIVLNTPILLTRKTVSVTGTVEDKETRKPIQGVTVEVVDTESNSLEPIATATTDENGSFTIKLPYGSSSLYFTHENYERYGKTVAIDSNNYLSQKLLIKTQPISLTPKSNSGDETDRTVIDSGECGADGDNVTWTLYDDGELEIIGIGEMMDYTSSTPPWYSKRSYITSVYVEGITNIGDCAFWDCNNITVGIIAADITRIGNEAFGDCFSLECLIIPSTVTSIGDYAFWCCNSLTNFIIPDSVTNIGDYAFSCCDNLTSITIPDSVTSIGDSTFSPCNSLINVYYTGTKEQWNNITIGNDNSDLLNATIHYNS